MTQRLNNLFVTFVLVHLCFSSFGQTAEKVAYKLQLTVDKIDSICASIDNNKKLVEGIIEGGFFNQTGGWETYDLKSKSFDTLFRIQHNSSTDLYYKTTFYYHDKKVIKSIVEIEDWNSGSTMKPIYSAIYYFDDLKPIKVLNENKKYTNSTDILNRGLNYQSNYYNNNR